MNQQLVDALRSEAPQDIERFCEHSFREARELFNAVVPTALSGNRAAAFTYVSTWRALAERILHAVHSEQPDLILEKEGRLFAIDVKRWPAPVTRVLLEAEALDAPFSSWINRTEDVGLGTCAALVQRLREILPDLRPVELKIHALPHWDFSESDLRAFRRNVGAALNESDPPLERIRQVFDLSLTQLGDLFGVTRQAVTQWMEAGVPDERLEKVATVASIADLLDHQLKSDRIPGVVRRDAEAYGGLSAIDLIRQDQHRELMEAVRESFDWAVPA